MKTTVVPAQITTVEDRIAGSLTLPQIVLLIIPLIASGAIYACAPIRMHLNNLKIILMGLQFIFFGLLAIRFRGKIIADWLVIYLRFKLRPRQYIFTKNDIATREVETVVLEKTSEPEQLKPKEEIISALLKLPDKIKVDLLLGNPLLTASYKFDKKGGLIVTLSSLKQ